MRNLLVILSILLFLSGCAIVPQADRALGKLSQGDNVGAWKMINSAQKELSKFNEEIRCETQLAYLQILSVLVQHDFIPDDADTKAGNAFQYITNQCLMYPVKVVIAYNRYAIYFQNSYRPGMALGYIQQAITLANNLPFEQFASTSLLGAVYLDMGEIRDSIEAYESAIKLGITYFKRKDRTYKFSLDEFNQWNTFLEILKNYMDVAAIYMEKGDAIKLIDFLSPHAKSINKNWINYQTQYILYIHLAQLYIFAKDENFANQQLDFARQYAENYRGSSQQIANLDILYVEALLLFHQGNYGEAALKMNMVLADFNNITHKSLPLAWKRNAAKIYEYSGNLNKAESLSNMLIHDMENTRTSFSIDNRGKFYNTLSVEPYWSLIRIQAKQFFSNHKPSDFNELLKAISYYKSRALHETIDIKSVAKIDDLQENLNDDTLFIDIESTGDEVVLSYISKKSYNIFISDNQLIDKTLSAVQSLHRRESVIEITKKLTTLGKALLNKSFIDISDFQHIIISPDGIFNLIPFSALSLNSKYYEPIGLDHTFSIVSSPNALIDEHHNNNSNADDLLILSDPIYDTSDVIVKKLNSNITLSEEQFEELKNADINPLPETRKEAKLIENAFNDKNVVSLYQENATEDWLKNSSLTRFRYLHFATHGVLGGSIPGLYEPALILSSTDFNDGLLTRSEITTLKLNSELVVLSACDTAIDRYNRGDSIMGLTRSFMLSGSDAVIATLWPIHSRATVLFMNIFYNELSAGNTVENSLAAAQRFFINAGYNELPNQLSNPIYWAAFTLFDDNQGRH